MTEFASYVQCSFNLNSKKNNGVTIYNGLQNIYQGLAKQSSQHRPYHNCVSRH